MRVKVTKDDIFVAELEAKRLSRKARDARILSRIVKDVRMLGDIDLTTLSDEAQRLLPPLKRKVAAMRVSGALAEAKAKRDATLAKKDRTGLIIPGGPFWND